MKYIYLLTPNMEFRADQSTDTSKVQFGEVLFLLVLLPEIWVRGYLQKQNLLKDRYITTAHTAGNLEYNV